MRFHSLFPVHQLGELPTFSMRFKRGSRRSLLVVPVDERELERIATACEVALQQIRNARIAQITREFSEAAPILGNESEVERLAEDLVPYCRMCRDTDRCVKAGGCVREA